MGIASGDDLVRQLRSLDGPRAPLPDGAMLVQGGSLRLSAIGRLDAARRHSRRHRLTQPGDRIPHELGLVLVGRKQRRRLGTHFEPPEPGENEPVNDQYEPIVARLRRPREKPRAVRRSGSGWGTDTTGGHVPAGPDTIRFVRERFVDDRGLLAVEYEDEDHRPWYMVFGVSRSGAEDWRITGAAGGGRSEPRSSVPWANLGGWWNDRIACAGGRVQGAEVRRVRLVAAAGETAEDDIGESDIALVLAVGPFAQPWTVGLYDAAGDLLRSHPFKGDRSSPS